MCSVAAEDSMTADIGTFCVSAEDAQSGMGQAPCTLHPTPAPLLFLHYYIG